MKCIVCKGQRIIVKNDQSVICDNCEGSGEIITQEEVYGNDCRTGQC